MEKKNAEEKPETAVVPAKLDPIERKLVGMLLRLPKIAPPLGSYLPLVRSGKLVFVSGQLPLADNILGAYKGRLGREISLEAAQRGAKQCTLNALAWFKQEFGSLDKLKRVIKLTGFVAGMPGFTEQARVLNGASDFLVELYGEAGKHARVSVGVTDLPLGACVEIDYLFESK
jgi:enamine deaminase RidA (YjgF/YER057c/UK114 family)